ncbi:MAG: hypothetical protein GX196_01715 [Clostridiaceae bacterium]|nr:hypothetical protein [Clostridiaceae bacterium]
MSDENKKAVSPTRPQAAAKSPAARANAGVKSGASAKSAGAKGRANEKNISDKNNEKVLIALTVIASLVLVIILMFVFNIFNIRTMFRRATTDYDRILSEIQAERAALAEEEKRVNDLIEKQKAKEDELKNLQNDIKERERQLVEQYGELYQAKADGTAQGVETKDEEAKKEQLQKTVKIYEQMEAQDAAKIISALPFSEKVEILSLMKNQKAAQILSQMDAKESARILSEIAKK